MNAATFYIVIDKVERGGIHAFENFPVGLTEWYSTRRAEHIAYKSSMDGYSAEWVPSPIRMSIRVYSFLLQWVY